MDRPKLTRGDYYLYVVDYEESMGEYSIPDDLKVVLKDKPLEEQTDYFAVVENSSTVYYSYGKSDGERAYSKPAISIWEPSRVLGVIVDDGMVVGIWVKIWDGSMQPLFVGQTRTVYFACDQDGTGSTDVEDDLTLIIR